MESTGITQSCRCMLGCRDDQKWICWARFEKNSSQHCDITINTSSDTIMKDHCDAYIGAGMFHDQLYLADDAADKPE